MVSTASLAIVAAVHLVSAGASAEPFRETLISTEQNIDVADWEICGARVTPGCSTPWSVRKVALHGGKQEGVSLIVVDNGKLRLTVVPTRGMGVLSVVMGDARLGWDSPVKEVVHPKFVNLESRGGLGWLDGFNEWMCRCGLEWMGHPGPDKFITNVGDEAVMSLTLHGKIANIPARDVEVVVDRESPYRIRVWGRVDERLFFGPKLELRTEISTEPGSNSFRIADEITNDGAQDQEFQIVYHCNHGRPLLGEGSTFVAPVARVSPFNATAAKGVGTFDRYAGPTAGYIEQVYCLKLHGDQEGRTLAMLRNKAGDRAVAMAFSTRELPCFTLWKNTTAEKDGYVTGLEPGTSYSYNRSIERKLGRVPKLAPGASRRIALDVSILSGAEQVGEAAGRVRAIQAGRAPRVDREPPKLD
ncbi:MAG: aldose 1-epimerase family protein [Phycisphaerae bacterium]|nr:aldose 1-epimerase family protein [Phycisphaerae bacterium]